MTTTLKEIRRRLTADEVQKQKEQKIQSIKNEIHNMQIILQSIPKDQEGARELLTQRIESLHFELPKFEGRIWWHWLLEWCPKCQSTVSQSPFPENLGEDCMLFSEIDEYHFRQKEGETDFKCSCGTKLNLKYHHAIANLNEEEKAEAFAYADSRTRFNSIN